MLKKYKILMVIIILSLTGIIAVISIWLYGSYSYRLDVAVNEVERSLFNSIQSYYHQNTDNIKQRNNGYYKSVFSSKLIEALTAEYENIDSVKIRVILDSLVKTQISRHGDLESFPKQNRMNRFIVPSYALEELDFGVEALTHLDSLLQHTLEDKGIAIRANVVLVNLKANEPRKFKPKVLMDSLGFIITRPVLVDSDRHEYLRARFDIPYKYVLGKMFWQLLVALVLVLGLIGTFTYLFWTINRQNRLAILRKSFINNMTHELKTPVSTLTAAIESVIRIGENVEARDRVKKYLHVSQHELLHLTKMIDKVLQLNIDEVTGLQLDISRVNLNMLVSEAVELGKLISAKPIDIRFEGSTEEIFIYVDEAHLKNVLNNLLDNAIKYSKDKVVISFSLFKEGRHVVIKVSDRGIGIPNNYLKDIFEMFFRVPTGDIHTVKGFGLGLAYVKQVTDQHGGCIDVQSELGKGTTFLIKLPM